MDLTGKVKAEAAMDDSGKNFELILRNTTMKNQPRDYTMDASIAPLATTHQDGKDLVLDVALAGKQTMKNIKVFALRPELSDKKINRLVVDIPRPGAVIAAAPPEKAPPAKFYSISSTDKQVLKGKIICIDPGHGGTDTGAIGSLNGKDIYEKDITLSIALPLRDMLTSAGAKVLMTRSTDRDVYKPYDGDVEELQARVDVANRNKADAFVSIHIDSFSNPDVDGTTAYYYPKTDNDYRLAKTIHDANLHDLWISDRGTRSNDLYVNVHADMPSVLLEMGYISNPHRLSMLTTNWAPKSIAKSIFNGLVAYFKG